MYYLSHFLCSALNFSFSFNLSSSSNALCFSKAYLFAIFFPSCNYQKISSGVEIFFAIAADAFLSISLISSFKCLHKCNIAFNDSFTVSDNFLAFGNYFPNFAEFYPKFLIATAYSIGLSRDLTSSGPFSTNS